MEKQDFDALKPEIKAEYIGSKISLRELAKKYDVSLTTLSRACKSEKWVDARRQTDDKATAKIVKMTAKRRASIRNKLYTSAEKMLEKIDAVVNAYNPDSSGCKKQTSLKDISGAMLDLKKILDAKSEDDVKEQKARIKKLEKEIESGDTAKEVVIRVEGGDVSWEK